MTSPDETPDDSFDPIADLTIDELGDGSRQLKASLITAVTQGTQDYERAMAVVLWLYARRTDPGVALGKFLRLRFIEVTDQLRALAPEADTPTTPTPSP